MNGKEDGKPMSAMADAQQKTRARLYHSACGGDLDPAENGTCGPLQWLDAAIRVLREVDTEKAISAAEEARTGSSADSGAYWEMVGELEQLHRGLSEAFAAEHTEAVALRTIVQLLGNVDHSRGGGENAARTYGGMLEDIRDIACRGLGARPEVVRALQGHDAFAKAVQAEREARERYAMGLLVEEMGEALCHLGRAARFGLDTTGQDGVSERDGLDRELGDLKAATRYASRAGLTDGDVIAMRSTAKFDKLTDPEARDNLGRRLAPALPPLEVTPGWDDATVPGEDKR